MNDYTNAGKSGLGCLLRGLIACVVIAVLLLAVGYYTLFHTAVPAKFLVGMINKDPNVQIVGIEGSIKSGFAVASMRFKDHNGNTNALDDVRLKYKKDGDRIVITEVHVGRGYFYVDRSKQDEFEMDGGIESSDSSGGQALSLLVKSISINDITIEDVSSGEKFKLEGLNISDFSIGENFSMGKAVVKCTGLDLSIEPVGGAKVGTEFTINGLAKPALHKNLIAPIDLTGTMEAGKPGETRVELAAFSGKITAKRHGEDLTIAIADFNCCDYFEQAPPLEDVELTMQVGEEEGIVKGRFKVGGHEFLIDQTLEGTTRENATPLIARSVQGQVEYRLQMSPKAFDKGDFSKMVLSTTPKMNHQDALASLLVGKRYDELAAEEKSRVDAAATSLLRQEP